MKQIKTLLFVLVFVPLLVGTVSAAQLKVLLVGTGRGDVEGEEISCEPFCEETYEKGAVVHLKAFPDDDSAFEGWMVNGKPHEGVITIDQDVILVTARFELKTPPDELQVMWYDGNYKEWMTMALDEIAIFPAKRRDKVFVLEGESKTAMEEVARLFHPQAEVVGLSQLEITIKSPEPVAKERLPEILAAMKQHEYVWQAGPVLYLNPNDPESEVIPTEKIMVQFPASYTEEQIIAIEQEYGLVRFESYPDDPYFFVYQAEDPLKAIEVANRLYESGLVELSTPDALVPGALLNQFLEVDSLADHWHLRDSTQHGADVIGAWNLNDKKNPRIPFGVRGW